MTRRRRAGENSPRIIISSSLSSQLSSSSDSLLEPDFEGSRKPKEGNNPRKWHCHNLVSHRLRDPALLLLAAFSRALYGGVAAAAAAVAPAFAMGAVSAAAAAGAGKNFSVGGRILRPLPLAWALSRRLRS